MNNWLSTTLVMFEMENSLKRPGNTISLADAREIAREAYIFGYPMVANYRVQYTYFVNRQNPEFKAPWNHIANIPRVYTPDDRATVAPNWICCILPRHGSAG